MPEIDFPDPPLSDGTVTLRAARESDVPAVTEACRDPLIARYTLVPSPYSERDAVEWQLVAEAQRLEGAGIHLLVVDSEDRLLGSIGLSKVDWQHRVGQVGYWVAPDARRRGVASRAVRLLSRWALRSLGLARVEIRADVENEASHRVAEACGFTREGVLRSRAESKGRRWDEVMFSLLPADLEAVSGPGAAD
jgi:RimJ/RimL family protein N-acetyltransferase